MESRMQMKSGKKARNQKIIILYFYAYLFSFQVELTKSLEWKM